MSGIDYLNRLAGPFSRRDLLRLSLTGAVGYRPAAGSNDWHVPRPTIKTAGVRAFCCG